MNSKAFVTHTNGKWILVGEHAVLRGAPALVFPLKSRQLELQFTPRPQSLSLQLEGERGAEFEPLFWAVLERACDLMKLPKSTLTGELRLKSALPIGAGLGASAAFCVAMTRWFHSQGLLQTADLYEFARTLENLFHGESSGVDIAVAMSGEPLHFEREGEKFSLEPKWTPCLTISFCGQRGITADAVRRVKALFETDPLRARQIDQRMFEASNLCEKALLMEPSQGLSELAKGMEMASSCFRDWGLSEGALDEHMHLLRELGALAVKPTGSGGGGYALALWASEPPSTSSLDLIRCT